MLKAYLLVGYQLFCLNCHFTTVRSAAFAPPAPTLRVLYFHPRRTSRSFWPTNTLQKRSIIYWRASTSPSKGGNAQQGCSRIINGAKMSNFIIGRQLLIIALAFLFKLSYDSASLTPTEAQALSQGQTSCFLKPDWIRVLYSILDSWLFPLFCALYLSLISFRFPPSLWRSTTRCVF